MNSQHLLGKIFQLPVHVSTNYFKLDIDWCSFEKKNKIIKTVIFENNCSSCQQKSLSYQTPGWGSVVWFYTYWEKNASCMRQMNYK